MRVKTLLVSLRIVRSGGRLIKSLAACELREGPTSSRTHSSQLTAVTHDFTAVTHSSQSSEADRTQDYAYTALYAYIHVSVRLFKRTHNLILYMR